jgi:hypothetical protein
MEDLTTNIFFWGGVLVILPGWLWLVALAYQESPIWGAAVLLVPFVAVIYILKSLFTQNLDRCWKPAIIWIVGNILLGIGWDRGITKTPADIIMESTPKPGIRSAHLSATRSHEEMIGKNFVGMRLIDIHKVYGLPTKEEHPRDTRGTVFVYGELELISANGGFSVTGQRMRNQGSATQSQESSVIEKEEQSKLTELPKTAPEPPYSASSSTVLPKPEEQNFVGKTMEEIENILGTAQSKIELGDTIVYQFGNWEITSEDGGKTVSKQKNTKKETGSDY